MRNMLIIFVVRVRSDNQYHSYTYRLSVTTRNRRKQQARLWLKVICLPAPPKLTYVIYCLFNLYKKNWPEKIVTGIFWFMCSDRGHGAGDVVLEHCAASAVLFASNSYLSVQIRNFSLCALAFTSLVMMLQLIAVDRLRVH